MKGQAIFQRRSRLAPAENLNRAVGYVVRRAQSLTSVVGVAKIDTQMRVTTSPAVLKNGKLTKNKRRMNEVVNVKKGSVPIAALIVNAQVHSGPNAGGASRLNRLTGFRYSRLFSPFRGVSRRTGAAKMRAAISRLVKSRHSSSGFLKSSWTSIWKKLMPGSAGGPPTSDMGRVTPAVPGSTTATCTIENLLGMDSSTPAVLNESRNRAAHRILAPALQTAIDTEFASNLKKFDEKQWKDAAPLLAQYGFVVKT